MKRKLVASVLAAIAFAAVATASQPPSASAIVGEAVTKAKAEHKGILVIFHASWCGWCKQLDKTLDVPAFKAVVDKDLVVIHVTVLENDSHKSDENPGGVDYMAAMGGADAGLPFFVALNADGRRVADSKVVEGKDPKPQNMGFPTEPVEIDHFIEMVKAANPALTQADASTLHQVLVQRAQEIKAPTAHR